MRIETDRHGFVLCVERIRDRALDKQKIIRLDRVLGLKEEEGPFESRKLVHMLLLNLFNMLVIISLYYYTLPLRAHLFH